ncbi:Sas10/Utp3/C1D family protein [Stagonosporopsis vannaccii]|nr:Sas10/Utp3/C1D family protein [Stagonosporopsis vannaccii]
MDPQTDLPDLVEDLEANIDELASTLAALLPPQTLSKTATTLPLLEKSKLYTLAAYAIESLLFSTLLTAGADAKSHAVFAELSRLKGYFAKIKHAEEHLLRLDEKDRRARLDVAAAQRFIKHGLSGNERYDEMRRERMRGEKERALEKARQLTNRKFDDEGDGEGEGDSTPERKRARGDEGEDLPEEEGEGEGEQEQEQEQQGHDDVDAQPAEPEGRGRGRGRKGRQGADTDDGDDDDMNMDMDINSPAPAPAQKKRGRPSKKAKLAADATTPQHDTPPRATRSSAPKTRSEAFHALASGSPAAGAAKGKGKKGKAKGR